MRVTIFGLSMMLVLVLRLLLALLLVSVDGGDMGWISGIIVFWFVVSL